MATENILTTLEHGKVVLYTRLDSQRSSIHYRIAIPGLTGYERRSTRTTDLPTAIRTAGDRYKELDYERIKGRAALPKTFKQVTTLYLADLAVLAKAGRASNERVKSHNSFIRNTLDNFFGTITVDQIREADLHAYKKYRIELLPVRLTPA